MSLEIGDQIPDLELPASDGSQVRLRDSGGKKRVVYFYPKDDTPGCTLEGQDFSARVDEFTAAGTEVFGVSRDNLKSHQKFCDKYEFTIRLLSDEDEAACRAFDVIKEKNMYGRKVMGIERSTFLFDADGCLARVWRKVKVKGHADEVLAAAREL